MKRIILSTVAATLMGLGAAAVANADGGTLPPPIITPATTCMNCK